MSIKHSTVKSVKYQREYSGKYGTIYIHDITFEDGNTGEYHGKEKILAKFIEGREYDYTIEAVTNGTHTSNRIKRTDTYNPNQSNMNYQDDPKKQLRIVKLVALECALEYAEINLVEDKALINAAVMKFLTWITFGNPDKDLSITKQACLKRSVHASKVPVLGINTVEQILENADKYFLFVNKE